MAAIREGFFMKVIDQIPVELDAEELKRALRAGRVREMVMDLAHLMEEGNRLIEPRAVYTFTKVKSIEKDQVHLESGHAMKSIIMADMLENGQTIAPYVVTIGPKLERQVSEIAKGSILQAWILEKIGDHALGKASAYTGSCIEETLGSNMSGFGPGTGTGRLFGIEQQKVLFQILDPPRNIGVCLTSSYLMVPRKSVSGVLAATSRDYVACQYCPRERCESRRKPYSGEYYAFKCQSKSSS